MGGLVALGEAALVEAFGLGGARVLTAEDPDAVRRAWDSLSDDIEVVFLTANAAAALADVAAPREDLLTVVLPR